ncbi:MAG: zf-HC2 domain-containing protein [Deltaproteobacteria bacterium]|nr:zf-HC2 domain-containing protein [Deltaproteobacteria bacterium]
MLSCKEVSLLVSQSLDRKLPFRQRVAVRMHLIMCKFCSRYKEQLLILKEAAIRYSGEDHELPGPLPAVLPPGARERIKHILSHHAHYHE